jgi:NCS1 family nucleobase:cation symporter-1
MVKNTRMSSSQMAEQETRYGVLPVLRKQRIYSFWDTFWVAGAYGIATWCYFQGGSLAQVMSFKQAIFSTMGAACGAVFLITVVGIFCNRFGIDHWIYFRAVLGRVGAPVLLLVALSSTWGYEAINAQMYGSSIIKLVNAAGASIQPGWDKWIGLTCVLFGWLIAMYGAVAVKLSTRLMGIALLAVGGLIILIILFNADLQALWNAQPAGGGKSSHASYMLGTEWNIAFTLGWFPVIGALGRLGKSERASHWGMWWGYGFLYAIFIVIGAAAAFVGVAMGADASGDPTDYLMRIGGPVFGLISVCAIALANITTQAVATYLMSVSTKVLNPNWNYKWIATFWCALSAVLTAWGGIWNYYNVFLAVIGVISGPALALIAADFWVIRKQSFDISRLFRKDQFLYTGGFNLVALTAFLGGCVSYFLIYDPLEGVARFEPLFNIFTATGFASLVTCVLYIGLSRLPGVRSYVLAEKELS